jgi:hypothetical protein
LGNHGHASTVFRRAIAARNVVAAELAAREQGRLDLADALDLAALIALRDPRVRGRRAGARWLRRWLEDNPDATIHDVAMVAGLLGALGGVRHAEALSALRAFTRA